MKKILRRFLGVVLLMGGIYMSFYYTFLKFKLPLINDLEISIKELDDETKKKDLKPDDFKYLSLRKDINSLKKEEISLYTQLLTTILQSLTLITVFIGLYFTWQTQKRDNEKVREELSASRKSLINERLVKAVTQLENDEKPVSRLSGMYTLQSIALEYLGDYSDNALNILAVFIRHKSPYPEKNASRENKNTESEPDMEIEVCLNIFDEVSRAKCKFEEVKNTFSEKPKWSIIYHTSLIKLEKLNIFLYQFHFEKSLLFRTTFQYGKFRDVNFIDSRIINDSKFEEARFTHVSFRTTEIESTSFKGAKFELTTFSNVKFKNVNLSGTSFESCIFKNCIFENVKLEGEMTVNRTNCDGKIFNDTESLRNYLKNGGTNLRRGE